MLMNSTLMNTPVYFEYHFLAGAMKALYTKGIVHRDLKPQNILLSHNYAKTLPAPSKITLKIGKFLNLLLYIHKENNI